MQDIWTEEEVKNLNDFQSCCFFHPFTCPAKSGEKHDLVATKVGWICPPCSGQEVLQTWAHDFMLNGEWRQSLPELEKLHSDPRVQKLRAILNNIEEKE
jgi:hypothetical protein